MDEMLIPRRLSREKVESRRRPGRPRTDWIEDVTRTPHLWESDAGGQPLWVRSNVPSNLRGYAAAKLEFFYYTYYKKLSKCRAVVRSCKKFLLTAVTSPRSCKQN
jgi:hypothetical protein